MPVRAWTLPVWPTGLKFTFGSTLGPPRPHDQVAQSAAIPREVSRQGDNEQWISDRLDRGRENVRRGRPNWRRRGRRSTALLPDNGSGPLRPQLPEAHE